ncbi:MAG: EamA family transporter, partial [Mesorhizobium sp.]
MTLSVFFAVLAAAAMHAIWNALVKVHLDRFLSITLMTLGMGAVALLALPFVEVPKAEAWPYIIASVIFHMGYRTFLIAAYKAGDFAQTYPLARGTAPLLAALGGIVVVAEVPAPLAILGIVLLSAGTLVLSFRGGAHLERLNLRAVGFALGTSIFIAGYTLSDGSGARLAATASSYAAWLFVCDALWALVLCLIFRGPKALPVLARDWKAGVYTGVLSGAAYWIVMWAMTKA